MERIELAKKVLRELERVEIPCVISSVEYRECFDLDMGVECARYLIKDKISDSSVLDGLEIIECTLQKLLDGVLISSIDDEENEYECESEWAENYVNSLALLINRILDGSISEDNLDDYLEYFSGRDFNNMMDDPLEDKISTTEKLRSFNNNIS